MATSAEGVRLEENSPRTDSTQRGCTSWLLISCVVLTMTTAFVFGWGLAAPNMYQTYTESFLAGNDSCANRNPTPANFSNEAGAQMNAEEKSADRADTAAGTPTDTDNAPQTNTESKTEDNDGEPMKLKSATEKEADKPKFNFREELVKGIPQTIFLIGAFIGALTGPNWVNLFDRKRTVFANYIFCFASSLCVLLSYYFKFTWLFYLSRLLLGYQGGMACTVVPPFLGEISSQRVRGASGAAFQLSLTIGILVAQVVGLPFVAGTCTGWGWGLAIVFLLPLSGLFLLYPIPNSPTQMIGKYNNEQQAMIDLKKLRGTDDVQADITLIREETIRSSGSRSESLSIPQVLKSTRYRWPMLITILLQSGQALSGINAVFFYSSKMFARAGIKEEHIPYANIGTGIINVLATIVAISIIEKVGRRALVIYPMIAMVFVFGFLTVLVEYNETRNNPTIGLASVIFILIFIVCFAVGLGPIPFLYSSEVCRPEARDAIQSLGLIANYLGNIFLSLFFPVLNAMLGGYVFIIFVVLVLIHVSIFWFKMPETRNKSIDDAEKFWNIAPTKAKETLLSGST